MKKNSWWCVERGRIRDVSCEGESGVVMCRFKDFVTLRMDGEKGIMWVCAGVAVKSLCNSCCCVSCNIDVVEVL